MFEGLPWLVQPTLLQDKIEADNNKRDVSIVDWRHSGQGTKRNWYKTTHYTHIQVCLVLIHQYTSFCGHRFSNGPTKELSLWWLSISAYLSSHIPQPTIIIQDFVTKNFTGNLSVSQLIRRLLGQVQSTAIGNNKLGQQIAAEQEWLQLLWKVWKCNAVENILQISL